MGTSWWVVTRERRLKYRGPSGGYSRQMTHYNALARRLVDKRADAASRNRDLVSKPTGDHP
jgi:hypothetical protein